MAMIGLKYAYFARIKSETDGSLPTYETGKVVGMLATANVSFSRNNARLYADDTLAEYDNSINGGTLSISLDDITSENAQYMLGLVADGDDLAYTDGPAPYGGFGYLRVRQKKGKVSYIGYWHPKVAWSMDGENASSKGQSVSFDAPALTGEMMGVNVTAAGGNVFRLRSEDFATEAEALAWLKTKANVTT